VNAAIAAFPVATDTVQGKVSLAVAANFPSVSNVEAVTPAYLNAALVDASATTKGLVNLQQNQVLGAGAKIIDTIFTRHVALGAGSEMDLQAGDSFSKTVSAATTLSFSNIPASGLAATVILELTNGGSAAVTWPANTDWEGGTPPALTAAGVDVLGFYTYNNGAKWHGLVLSLDSK
jgi:hypothetical protein